MSRVGCIEYETVRVLPSGDSNSGLRVRIYLNLTHALNRSATPAGLRIIIFWNNFEVYTFTMLIENL